jgi:integrase
MAASGPTRKPRDVCFRAAIGSIAEHQASRGAVPTARYRPASGPFTPDAVNRLVKRIGERAGFAFPFHAHMLRHACGYALANAGHDTRRIQDGSAIDPAHDALSQLSAAPFKDFWR